MRSEVILYPDILHSFSTCPADASSLPQPPARAPSSSCHPFLSLITPYAPVQVPSLCPVVILFQHQTFLIPRLVFVRWPAALVTRSSFESAVGIYPSSDLLRVPYWRPLCTLLYKYFILFTTFPADILWVILSICSSLPSSVSYSMSSWRFLPPSAAVCHLWTYRCHLVDTLIQSDSWYCSTAAFSLGVAGPSRSYSPNPDIVFSSLCSLMSPECWRHSPVRLLIWTEGYCEIQLTLWLRLLIN